MIKQMAWNTFKNTGSIDSYLELVQLENMEKTQEKQNNHIKNNLGENIGIDTNNSKE